MKKLLTLLAVVLCLTAIAGIALAVDLPEHSVVAWGEVDSITSIEGHYVDWYEVVVPATCTTQGVAHYHCTDDGGKDTLHIMYIAAGHQWSSKSGIYEWGAIIKEATCYEEGLAIDVCLRCKQTNPDVTRVIQKTSHKFDATTLEDAPVKGKNGDWYIGYFILKAGETDFSKHYVVCTAPTCADSDWPDSQAGEGDGWRVCTNPGCGYVDKSVKVSLRRLPHTWSDWKVHKAATCLKEGYATHVCAGCGKLEELTVDTDKTAYAKLVAIKNPNWDNTMDPIKLTMQGKKGGCEYEVYTPETWLTGCYSKRTAYICPYCKCDNSVLPGTPHKKVVDDSGKLVSHIYKTTAQPYDTTYSTMWKYTDAEDKARVAYAKKYQVSLKPSCLYDGIDLYICSKWDAEHDDNTWDDARFKVVRVPALGHNLSDWKLIDTYEKAGKTIYVFARQCLNCGTMETKATFNPEGTGGCIVDSIKLSKSKVKVKVGETYQLTVKMLPANDEQATVTWKSSKKSVASVSSDGLVTAKKKGTATITVTVKAKIGGTFTAKCKVTVK